MYHNIHSTPVAPQHGPTKKAMSNEALSPFCAQTNQNNKMMAFGLN
jgi:hypothetical protein